MYDFLVAVLITFWTIWTVANKKHSFNKWIVAIEFESTREGIFDGGLRRKK